MEFVTYENLFAFSMLIISIIGLCVTIFEHKK